MSRPQAKAPKAMPKFYLHLLSPLDITIDETGRTVGSVEVAYLEACDQILSQAHAIRKQGYSTVDYSFEIMDKSGCVIIVVPFTEPIDRSGKPQ